MSNNKATTDDFEIPFASSGDDRSTPKKVRRQISIIQPSPDHFIFQVNRHCLANN